MSEAPKRIWAVDGETPYYYEEGEDRPDEAVEYVRAAEIERLREALRFYATGEWSENYPGGVLYDPNGTGITTHVDYGEIARAALGEDG